MHISIPSVAYIFYQSISLSLPVSLFLNLSLISLSISVLDFFLSLFVSWYFNFPFLSPVLFFYSASVLWLRLLHLPGSLSNNCLTTWVCAPNKHRCVVPHTFLRIANSQLLLKYPVPQFLTRATSRQTFANTRIDFKNYLFKSTPRNFIIRKMSLIVEWWVPSVLSGEHYFLCPTSHFPFPHANT